MGDQLILLTACREIKKKRRNYTIRFIKGTPDFTDASISSVSFVKEGFPDEKKKDNVMIQNRICLLSVDQQMFNRGRGHCMRLPPPLTSATIFISYILSFTAYSYHIISVYQNILLQIFVVFPLWLCYIHIGTNV